MNRKPRIVIYHRSCWDGFCAAWLLHLVWPDATFLSAQYGDAPPDCTGRQVVIADFSYSRDVLWSVAAQAASLVVLDHHQTAQQALEHFERDWLLETGQTNVAITFDMEKSGAHLTLDYLQANAYLQPEVWPWLMLYTEDRDLWRWALPGSREINACIRSYPLDFAVWDRIAAFGSMYHLEAGAAILRRENQIIAEHVERAYEVTLGGYRVPCVNATVLFSDIAGELAKGKPFAICWFDRADGKRQFSLRSDAHGVDVSEIAKRFGGGGHQHAAGFWLDAPVPYFGKEGTPP